MCAMGKHVVTMVATTVSLRGLVDQHLDARLFGSLTINALTRCLLCSLPFSVLFCLFVCLVFFLGGGGATVISIPSLMCLPPFPIVFLRVGMSHHRWISSLCRCGPSQPSGTGALLLLPTVDRLEDTEGLLFRSRDPDCCCSAMFGIGDGVSTRSWSSSRPSF